MAKTPLLLMFGRHHGDIAKHQRKKQEKVLKGDTRFFKRSAKKFFKDRILTEGRRGIVIRELAIVIDTDKLKDDKGRKLGKEEVLKEKDNKSLLDQIQGVLDEAAGYFLATFRSTLDNGLRVPRVGEWGHEPQMLAINSKHPGRITTIIEPQTAEALIQMWEEELLCERIMEAGINENMDKLIQMKLEEQRIVLESLLHRDEQVFKLAKRLAQEEPGRAIIIPRGSAHSAMAQRFFANSDLFDIECHVSREESSFGDEELIRAYCNGIETVTMEERERIARLNLYWSEYKSEHIESVGFGLLCRIGASDFAYRRMVRKAREYALAMDGQ